MGAIGGYFELELLSGKKNELYSNLIRLNTGRNCLEYILNVRKYSKIYIPFFTCDVIIEPFIKTNTKYEFYNINEQLEPMFDYNVIKKTEAFLITNYFGIKDSFIENLSKKNINLIVDNSQALFAKPIKNIDTFYSPRKFLGIPDGGLLSINKTLYFELDQDISYNRFNHLLKRIDISPEYGYKDFIKNDILLQNQPMKYMSKLTIKLLNQLDYKYIRRKRVNNYNYLVEKLNHVNKLKLFVSNGFVPLVYPLRINDASLVRKHLAENKIYSAVYWPNVLEWANINSIEAILTNEIIHLPIDQRYSIKDMKYMIKLIKENEG